MTRVLARRQRRRQIRPTIWIEALKPIRDCRVRMMKGYSAPPMPPAVRAREVASARRCLNQWPMQTVAGVKIRLAESPPKTPQLSM